MTKKPWLIRWFFRSPPVRDQDAQLRAMAEGPEAANNLGALFSNTANHEDALVCYRRAADAGHALAQNNLGMMYAAGEGVARDETEARRWFARAAEQGDAAAQFHLGGCLHRASLGLPEVEADEARIEAFKWLHLATSQAYPRAEDSREMVNLRMSREAVTEGARRARCFVARIEVSLG